MFTRLLNTVKEISTVNITQSFIINLDLFLLVKMKLSLIIFET